MKKTLLALAAFLCSVYSYSQLSYGGEPANWSDKSFPNGIPTITFDQPDLEQLAREDAITDQHKDVPYRFGFEHEVSGLENSGTWIVDEMLGRKIFRIAIECQGARAVSLRFDRFNLLDGEELYIWSADREEYIGAFTSKNNKKSGRLATGLVHGEKIIVEYSLPLKSKGTGEIQIGQVVHVYRSFLNNKFLVDDTDTQRGPFGDSGNCEVNVNCPEGAAWQVEKRSVAIITEGGYGYCTGALVNNTANDGTPYFLTANHCIQGTDVGDWVFYFNHESVNCNGTTGPTNQSISGSSVVANNSNSDFALLLLDDVPPASFNVQYAGWNASDDEDQVESAVGIHHPNGDIKKISFEDDAPYHDIGNGAEVWWIDDWELGVTEPGSSGSPLFDQDHRIIGQLFGGASACNGNNGNGQFDFYGRFGESWDAGSSSSSRLREWLDPGNSGTLILDGYPEGFEALAVDPGLGAITNVPENNCSSFISPYFTLFNHGTEILTSCTINYQVNAGAIQTINWTGNLTQNNSDIIELPEIAVQGGNNTLVIWVTNPSDGNSDNNEVSISFTAVSGTPSIVTLELVFDDYPEETYWVITDEDNNPITGGGTYENQSNGSTLEIDVCLSSGCYNLVMYDDYGDGMCCEYGNGSYALTEQDGTTLASGDEFDDSEINPFCVDGIGIDELLAFTPIVYPNPSSGEFQVTTSQQMTEIRLFDATGKLVLTSNPNATNISLNTTQLADGIYHLHAVCGLKHGSTRILIRH